MASASAATSRVALDAMGGDKGPEEMVAACAQASRELKNKISEFILVGDEKVLNPLLKQYELDQNDRVTVRHASEVITMEDKPLRAFRQKKDSSMRRAVEMVKKGEADAVVSCGNTGSLIAGGTIRLRTLQGVDRPALASVIPHQKGHFILIDAGANPEAKSAHLVHNAIMGSIYCRIGLGVKNPRVGLLTIGTEEGKGTERINETHQLLKKMDKLIDYRGPIEGFQIFENEVDVVVCDGFVGNILLKTCEGMLKHLSGSLKAELTQNLIRKLGVLLTLGAYKSFKARFSPEKYGGAPLMGLGGNVLKAHGSSNRNAIFGALRIASEILDKEMNNQIIEAIREANEIMEPEEALNALET
ncbi:MAG: phosphate acyltransferase PlsX [Opitutales bacterium]|nr:phosphate acyltransferase PlsX [Opitutales bacterium]MCH8540109.1 phosphate acyltransferase PlsX [Opitutales bacterium]